MTSLERIKIKLGISAEDSSKDGLISVYYEDAAAQFCAYCNRDYVPTAALGIVQDMVIAKYNKFGLEGLASQSYSGISQSYLTDYSDNTKFALNKFRRLKTV